MPLIVLWGKLWAQCVVPREKAFITPRVICAPEISVTREGAPQAISSSKRRFFAPPGRKGFIVCFTQRVVCEAAFKPSLSFEEPPVNPWALFPLLSVGEGPLKFGRDFFHQDLGEENLVFAP